VLRAGAAGRICCFFEGRSAFFWAAVFFAAWIWRARASFEKALWVRAAGRAAKKSKFYQFKDLFVGFAGGARPFQVPCAIKDPA